MFPRRPSTGRRRIGAARPGRKSLKQCAGGSRVRTKESSDTLKYDETADRRPVRM